MANELISKEFSKYKIADVFKGQVAENDLGAGITAGGFAVVGFKGKTWSYRYQGEGTPLMRADGDGPQSSIDVVIIASSRFKSKVWYEKGYVEGANASPDCWSGNGLQPDPTSPKIQSENCADCPRNRWGGRITENNRRAKECSDSKRLAVVPLDDIANEKYGGPMLLRVPAASLAALATYGNEMSKLGFPYFSIGTKITFDPQESYPKFVFEAIRPLNNKEGPIADAMREDPLIERILNETASDPLIEGVAAAAPVTSKVINSEVAAAGSVARKSKVSPRKAAPVEEPEEEIEDAEVVEEPAASAADPDGDASASEEVEDGGDDEEAFDKALDAKLSKFLGGKKSS